MTPQRFVYVLRWHGWSQTHIAGLLGCQKRIIGYWMRGERDGYRSTVPPIVAEWLEARMRGEDRPPPTNWKRMPCTGSIATARPATTC